MDASPSNTPGLKRSLSVWAAVGLSVALMAPSMAANINPQGSATTAGRAVPLTFLIAAVGVLLVAYSFVRLCQYFHHSGSVYAFVGAGRPRGHRGAGRGGSGTGTPARDRARRGVLVVEVLPLVAEQPLVDHHCHGVLSRDAAGVGAAGFADAVRSALVTRTAAAVGVKSIAAYRTGLDLRAERPSDFEVTAAAGRWLAASTGPPRLADETLQRFLIWCGVDL